MCIIRIMCLRTVHLLLGYFGQCMLYSCSRTSDCIILNHFAFECQCYSNIILKFRQTSMYPSVYVATNHQMWWWHYYACSKIRCIEFQVFSISSSNSSTLLLIHTEFSAENKPRFPHTDVARKVGSWHNEQEWFQSHVRVQVVCASFESCTLERCIYY